MPPGGGAGGWGCSESESGEAARSAGLGWLSTFGLPGPQGSLTDSQFTGSYVIPRGLPGKDGPGRMLVWAVAPSVSPSRPPEKDPSPLTTG